MAPRPLDKDGITAAVLMAEIAAVAVADGVTLQDRLDAIAERFGRYVTAELSVKMPPAEGAAWVGGDRSRPAGRGRGQGGHVGDDVSRGRPRATDARRRRPPPDPPQRHRAQGQALRRGRRPRILQSSSRCWKLSRTEPTYIWCQAPCVRELDDAIGDDGKKWVGRRAAACSTNRSDLCVGIAKAHRCEHFVGCRTAETVGDHEHDGSRDSVRCTFGRRVELVQHEVDDGGERVRPEGRRRAGSHCDRRLDEVGVGPHIAEVCEHVVRAKPGCRPTMSEVGAVARPPIVSSRRHAR